jgi:hypothetical protein
MNDPAESGRHLRRAAGRPLRARNRATSTRVISASIVDREGNNSMKWPVFSRLPWQAGEKPVGPARGQGSRRLARLADRPSLQPAGKRRGSAISHDLKAGPGRVMIRCAESGEGVPAGVRIDAATFKTSNLSDQTVRCPHCGQEHTWSTKDAWIEEVC